MLTKFIENITTCHIWALALKETREILHNKYLLFLILIPPTIQLLILGGALDPQVRNLSMAVVDHSMTRQSRQFIDNLSKSGTFQKSSYSPNETELSHSLESGKLDTGIVIPADFALNLDRSKPAPVQILLDGANAYSAGIAGADILLNINHYYGKNGVLSFGKTKSTPSPHAAQLIDPQVDILYNPNQKSSWFFVPGILGACLTLTSTLVASASVLRERESGTMEQLLMTPAAAWEILLAKIMPLALFLLGDVCIAIFAAGMIFGLPCRGSFLLLLIASAFYSFVGIGLGMLLGSVCKSQRQAQLTSFFINVPLILLSGTVVPLDTLPELLRNAAYFNPLSYYTLIARGILLKGATFDMLWLPVCILALFAILTLALSTNRFRKQLV